MKKILIGMLLLLGSVGSTYAFETTYTNPAGTDLVGVDLSGVDSSLHFVSSANTQAYICANTGPGGGTVVSYVNNLSQGNNKLRYEGAGIYEQDTGSGLGIYQITCDYPDLHDQTVSTGFIGGLNDLVIGVFASLGSIIASPFGGLIILGLAISYLFYTKKMAKAKNISGSSKRKGTFNTQYSRNYGKKGSSYGSVNLKTGSKKSYGRQKTNGITFGDSKRTGMYEESVIKIRGNKTDYSVGKESDGLYFIRDRSTNETKAFGTKKQAIQELKDNAKWIARSDYLK